MPVQPMPAPEMHTHVHKNDHKSDINHVDYANAEFYHLTFCHPEACLVLLETNLTKSGISMSLFHKKLVLIQVGGSMVMLPYNGQTEA